MKVLQTSKKGYGQVPMPYYGYFAIFTISDMETEKKGGVGMLGRDYILVGIGIIVYLIWIFLGL